MIRISLIATPNGNDLKKKEKRRDREWNGEKKLSLHVELAFSFYFNGETGNCNVCTCIGKEKEIQKSLTFPTSPLCPITVRIDYKLSSGTYVCICTCTRILYRIPLSIYELFGSHLIVTCSLK